MPVAHPGSHFAVAASTLPQPSTAVAPSLAAGIYHSAGPLGTLPAHSSEAFQYRHEGPSFPYFEHDDPHEIAMLKMALHNLLSPEEPEQLKYHILIYC